MKGVQFEDREFQDDSRFKVTEIRAPQEIYSLGPEAFADLEVPETGSNEEILCFQKCFKAFKFSSPDIAG